MGAGMNWRIERLERLAELREKGALSDEEFNSEKAKIFGGADATLPFLDQSTAAQDSEVLGVQADSVDGTDSAEEWAEEWAESYDEQRGMNVRGWLKWPFILLAILGSVLILAKFGAMLAILIAVMSIFVHVYARSEQSGSAMKIALFGYVGAAGLFLAGWISESLIPESLKPKVYAASDFQNELKLCLQSAAKQGQIYERIATRTAVAKERMDWEISVGQDQMIAAQLYARDLDGLTRPFLSDLESGAGEILSDCESANQKIESEVTDLDNLTTGSLSVCHRAATDLVKMGKLAKATTGSEAADNLVSWPDVKPRFEECAASLHLTSEQLLASTKPQAD